MKNATKLLLLLLALMLSLSLFACGGGSDGGEGDGGEETTPASDVVLIEDGVPKFNIVYSQTTDNNTRNAIRQHIVSKLKSVDIEVTAVAEGGDNDVPQDIEVLIGDVTSRGEKYYYERHQFGKEGYMIKIVDSKVIIQAGSDEMLLEAVMEFAEEVLKIGTDDVFYATMLAGTKDSSDKKGNEVFYVQNDYKIKNLCVNGNNMKDYTIAADLTNEFFSNAALSIQDEIYEKTGLWLKLADINHATDKSIVIKSIDRVYNDNSFTVKAEGSKLVISCAFENMLERSTELFLTEKITVARDDVNFEGTVYKKDISFVTYEDFGAVGDGETDDFQALYYTHKSANEYGQKVIGTKGATYYLRESYFTDKDTGKSAVYSIPIKTHVDWNGCTIIIDDREMHNYSGGNVDMGATAINYKMAHSAVFSVLPNDEHAKIRFGNRSVANAAEKAAIDAADRAVINKIVSDGLKPGTTHIDLKLDDWDGDLMIIPYSANHKVYRRRGYGQYNGADMHEILVIDKNGKISDETKVMFNYQTIDYIEIYKLDESTAITIENAKIITRDSRIDHTDANGKFQGGYVMRGLNVNRSYTTVKNLEHVVTDGFSLNERAYDGLEGPSANGFFTASNANHVTFKDCIMPGRMKYNNSSSYNFSAATVNYIVLDGCIQSNFWITLDSNNNIIPSTEWTEGAKTSMGSVTINGQSIGFYWGLGGTNWCKNMEYLNSKISRFDAHQGLYDGRIINTEINDMELTGVGKLEIADVKWYSYGATTPLLFLRADYGYTWNGEITLKDVEAYVHRSQNLVISNHSYVNWYFGYTSMIPSVAIDNLDLYWFDTHETVHAGYQITLAKCGNANMHLEDTGAAPIIAYNDVDKDGFIDEPIFDINRDGYIDDLDDIDLDGNGDTFNTKVPYVSLGDSGLDEKTYQRGTSLPGVTKNINIVQPPEYLKVINNDGVNGAGGYKYYVTNTAGKGISDGLWYTTEDTMNGFFGGTKFYYGAGENDFFVGTVTSSMPSNSPFVFQ